MTDEDRTTSVSEIQVLSMLRHPNIIAYYDSFIAKEGLEQKGSLHGTLMIVMEYADAGTLDDFIKLQKKSLPEEEILNMFSQICLGLHHVHSQNTLHRDLKTSNILISGTGRSKVLKIGDFGISKVMTNSVAKSLVGTPSYLSPELCEGKPYDDKSDIWALGCILYEMTMLRKIFEGTNLPSLVLKIMKGVYDPIPAHYSQDLRELIGWMCRLDPEKRPQMRDLVATSQLQQHLIEAQISIGRVDSMWS
ncbi:Serine/threonine-protein kinase Nek8 [Clydaea vesicula]|uniref:non-specific serine/threonine protein kinase n=1 Tax=Clydaea vesicula TaxID=447962 RepID=A0AAD5U4L5_9FUNG|nr:Serine/threonine-protein kinase Nek8 [Clydaea vesicula]